MIGFFKKKTVESRFKDWILSLNAYDISEILGLNFGIFESPNGFKLYVVGSKTFQLDNDDWVLNEDFVPKEKYFDYNFKADNFEYPRSATVMTRAL